MKTLGKAIIGGAVVLAMLAPAGRADGIGGGKNTVRWETIVGLIQAKNTVGLPAITGGGQPWSTLGGQASVNLSNSTASFKVKGLVLAGGNGVGTPGPVTAVTGTLVCDPGLGSQAIIDTPPVPLDAQGNASFAGSFTAATDGCSRSAVAFLIRISAPTSPPNGLWIANGAVRQP